MHLLKDYRYNLPEDLIALKPAPQRDQSRLLVLNRAKKRISHHIFCEIADFFFPGDALIINDTEVVPGRLVGRKETGGRVEALIVDYPKAALKKPGDGKIIFRCMVKASKRLARGAYIFFENGLKAKVKDYNDGIYSLLFSGVDDFDELFEKIGKTPLPPYIKNIRRKANGADDFDDRAAYQTIYASKKGAIAAPTAGLHFSSEVFERLELKGVEIVSITLHVGQGTFLPVRASDIRKHRMQTEIFDIPCEAAMAINRAKQDGRRIVAVGTTCARALEYSAGEAGKIVPGFGECDLFIYPGHRFKAVDAMITNFHLPESTLLMLVSAFAGREMIFSAYKEAIEKKYRFYSYGDAMYIE